MMINSRNKLKFYELTKVDVTEKLVILSNGCAWRNQWSWDFFLCVFGGSYHLQGVFKKKKKK